MTDHEIEQVREVIKAEYTAKIDKLKDDMEAELIALSRLAPRLKSVQASEKPQPLVKSSRTIIPLSVGIGKRLSDALKRMTGDFTSAELLDAAIHDATGTDINKNSFYPKFSKMIKDGEVLIVSHQSGNMPGVYRKTEKTTVTSSSESGFNLLSERE